MDELISILNCTNGHFLSEFSQPLVKFCNSVYVALLVWIAVRKYSRSQSLIMFVVNCRF